MKLSAICGLIITICNSLHGYTQNYDTLKYIFLGHTYNWQAIGDRVDSRLEALDFSEFDRIWLGGDICSEASLEKSTLEYIDDIFDLSKPGNHWALGNHDARNWNWDWIEELTNRKTYYAHYENETTTILLNTCLTPANCEDVDNQWRIIDNVCDTISASTHLFLLMHHGIWDGVPDLPPPSWYGHSNLKYWNANCYSHNSTFVNAVYPKLVDVRARGIEVICIMGDAGAVSKEFYKSSVDSIHFFASGINNSLYTDSIDLANAPKDKVLIFEHIPAMDKVEWQFHDLDSLLQTQ